MKTWLTLLAAALAAARARRRASCRISAARPTPRSARAARRRSAAASCCSCATPASSSTIRSSTEYLSTLGSQLATHVNNGEFNFNFFVVSDDRINAFALPGGYIGVNSGLDPRERNRERARRRPGARDLARHAAPHRAREPTTISAPASCRWPPCSPRSCSAPPADMSGDAMQGVVDGVARRWPPSGRSTSRARTSTRPIASASSCCRAPASIRTACRASSRSSARRYGGSSQYVPGAAADAPRHARNASRKRAIARGSCPRDDAHEQPRVCAGEGSLDRPERARRRRRRSRRSATRPTATRRKTATGSRSPRCAWRCTTTPSCCSAV